MSFDHIPHPHSDDPHADCNLEINRLQQQLAAVRAKLETIVCTDEIDRGVVLLNHEGGTHIEVIGGREVTVYNHEHFSPLGDALIELWELTKGKE